jgi:outer membrane protein assembly factor BamB
MLIVSMLSCSAPAADASDTWPQFLGPTGDGVSTAKGIVRSWSETENIVWKTPIHGRGWSCPIIRGDQVWLTTATKDGKKLYAICVDRESGKVIRDLKLFDVESPRKIHVLNTYASPTPVIEDGRVYVHFGSYGTACLDTKTAKVLWTRRDLPCHHWRGPGSSPILFGDLLIVHYDGFDYQYVVAFDKKNGKTVWKTDRSNDFGGSDNGDHKKAYSTPTIIEVSGKPQLISAGSRAAMSYDPYTGVQLWNVEFRSFSSTARPFFGHGMVYINTGFGKADLIAVRPDGEGDVSKTHVEWTARRGIGSKPSAVMVDDLIYVVTDKGGVVSCLEAKTGEQVWSHRIGGGQHSASPIYVDGAIYFFSHDGPSHVIKAGREFELLHTNELDDGFMASPAVAGKSLFLRTRTHLYRIEERQ